MSDKNILVLCAQNSEIRPLPTDDDPRTEAS